jgi:hypothetical protein
LLVFIGVAPFISLQPEIVRGKVSARSSAVAHTLCPSVDVAAEPVVLALPHGQPPIFGCEGPANIGWQEKRRNILMDLGLHKCVSCATFCLKVIFSRKYFAE